ncbi:netrin receptor UNC5A-like [Anneissia japonica]|uniref:netrin receptor UNC5A-like n=1 Tax=Anneissia japonica TaxID=1529436 RepID=UPI001425931C|nr:netrin receptor UNC5A-like [Anneissia japonica]
MQLKPKWDVLKKSVDTLLKDLDFLLPRYFEEIGQRAKASSVPSAEDVIKSFQRLRTNDRVGQPLHTFVSLLKSLKNVLPFVKQIKDVFSYFDFQKSLVDSLKKIEDIAEGKRANDTVHPEVLNITKDLNLVTTDIYLPVISTVPSFFDNIISVNKILKDELSMGNWNVVHDDLLGVMLQATRAPRNLIEVDGQVINMYRKLSRDLEEERRGLIRENQIQKKMLLEQLPVPHAFNDDPDGDLGVLDNKTENGTTLEKMLRMFDQKVSMCKLKDVTRINFTTSTFSAGIFDSKGGNLTISDAGVNLYIPPGAIPQRTRKEIYIYLDPHAYLNLKNEKETRIAPIIHCGPPGTSFEEPFILSFPHCADGEDQWTFSGLIQNSRDPGDHWQHIGEDSDGICLVEGGDCIIIVNHFTKFTLAGIAEMDGTKRMNICTFGKCYNRSSSYTFKVCAFNTYDTNTVIKEQKNFKEERMDEVKSLKVQNTGKDVQVNLNNVKEGWKSEYEDKMTLKHDDLWYEKEDGCISPYCRFRLKTEDQRDHENVYCRIKVQQENNTDIKFLEIDSTAPPTYKVEKLDFGDGDINFQTSRRIFGKKNACYTKLDEKVCHDLCLHLDKEEPLGGRDWRLLAEKIGIKSDIIEKMKKMPNQTMFLLNRLSLQCQTSKEFCTKLYKILTDAKLEMASKLIEPFVTQGQ